MGYNFFPLTPPSPQYVFSVVAARATERGLQSAGVLVSEGRGGILRARLLTFLRDESRAPAAILVGALNTYRGEGNPGVVHPTSLQ